MESVFFMAFLPFDGFAGVRDDLSTLSESAYGTWHFKTLLVLVSVRRLKQPLMLRIIESKINWFRLSRKLPSA